MVGAAVIGWLVVFSLTYLVIATRQLHFIGLDRPAGATVGAVAMVVVGGLPMDAALRAIDLHAVRHPSDRRLPVRGPVLPAVCLCRADPGPSARSLLFALTFAAGGLSALLLNDTVCVLLTPLVVAVVAEAQLPPLP